MIPYRLGWLGLLVAPKGSFSAGVTVRALTFGLFAVAVCGASYAGLNVKLPVGPHEIAGAVIALVLSFRTNTAYARFWEGRTLWGSIVNASRNLARLVQAHGRDSEGAARITTWIVVFAHATRRSLRKQEDCPEVERLLMPEARMNYASAPHQALYAARQLSTEIALLDAAGNLAPMLAQQAEQRTADLVDYLGGCERIAKTPTPLGYVLLLQRCLGIFLASLPFALVEQLGLATPLLVVAVAYPVLMIEALGSELDDPFGHEPNDLPLTRICATIEFDLLGTPTSETVGRVGTIED